MGDVLEATTLVFEALSPLEVSERQRVIRAVTVLLEEPSVTTVALTGGGGMPKPRKPIRVPVQRVKVKASKTAPKAKRAAPGRDTTELENQIDRVLEKNPGGMKPREIGAIIRMSPQKYDFKVAVRKLVEAKRARAQGNTSTRIYFPAKG